MSSRRWHRQSVDALQADESPEQNYCPHGNADCTGPTGPGLPCWDCLVAGGDD